MHCLVQEVIQAYVYLKQESKRMKTMDKKKILYDSLQLSLRVEQNVF